MYAENDLDIRNRDNVRNNGEVFTPTPIVDSMNDLVPKSAWEDKEFVFIEPTCGNGQFLTRIFEKRIANGLSIEEALNTLIGMDITADNIWDSHKRLFELACSYMAKNGIEKGSDEWFEKSVRIIAIVRNNIFLVHDSLDVMNKYGKDGSLFAPIPEFTKTGNLRKDANGNSFFKKDSNGNLKWVEKLFVFDDPTKTGQEMKESECNKIVTRIKTIWNKHKDKMNSHTLAPFFA